MIKAKTSSITMAELRSLLIATESEIESESKSLSFGSLTALVAKNASYVYQLCKDNNCRMSFDEFCFYIQDKVTGQVLFQGMSDNGLYPIPVSHFNNLFSSPSSPTAFLGAKISQSMWHRLGHPSNVITSSMLSKSNVSTTLYSSLAICQPCLAGKFTKLPFPKSSTKTGSPFQVIHSDVLGHSSHTSIEEFRYYFSFIDECTRYC